MGEQFNAPDDFKARWAEPVSVPVAEKPADAPKPARKKASSKSSD